VKVKVSGIPATGEHISVIALQTTKENGENVTSDYATVLKENMNDIRIADKKRFADNNDYHYRRYINALDNEAGISNHTAWERDVDYVTVDYTMAWNDRLDVMALVQAHELTSPKHTALDLEKFGMHFELEIVKNYIIGTNGTDQGAFVEWVPGSDNTILKVVDKYATSAIDRTPIIRVLLKHGDNIVKVAYIKIRITRPGENPEEPHTYDYNFGEHFKFACNGDSVELRTKWQEMNTDVYADLNMSKDEFHNYYNHFEDIVAVNNDAQGNKIGDYGRVWEDNSGTNITEEGTHVLVWKMALDDLWKLAGKSITNDVKYYRDDNTYVIIRLHATIDDITKSYNYTEFGITKYPEMWKDNVADFNCAVVPSENNYNPANCVFNQDLNAPFVNEGGRIKFTQNHGVTSYKFTFCDDMKKVTNVGGINVNFTISADGEHLFANGEEIARINNDGTGVPFNLFEYIKHADNPNHIGNKLLNTNQLMIYIQLTGYMCGKEKYPVQIKFGSDDHFIAHMVRPVNIASTANGNFIDGVDMGNEGSYMKVQDLVNPYDWRDRYFTQYPGYWEFYGIFDVQFDKNDVLCDIGHAGTYAKIPETIEIGYAPTIGGVTPKFGFITYKNNGVLVQSKFNLKVKVTVTYGWGVIETTEVIVPVNPFN
jgi:hypothetical protein